MDKKKKKYSVYKISECEKEFNKKDIDKELEDKNNLYDFIKNNLELMSLFITFMVFLIDAFLSLNIAVEYNIPVKFVGIDMKTYIIFFIIFTSPFLYMSFDHFFKDESDKKNNQILSSIILSSIELVIILTIMINRKNALYYIYVLFKGKISGIHLISIIILILILLKNFSPIFLKLGNKTKAICQTISIFIYLGLITFLFVVRAKENQIITLKNGETKIVVGYSDGEYLVIDYEIEKSLRGYEIPKYTIPNFLIQKSELKKFDEVIFFGSYKEKEVQIITLKNDRTKIARECYDYKYEAYDYTIEENLKIYKKPVYKISSSDISEIELKKFKAINSSDLPKEKELQIITLNDGKQKVLLSEPSGEYGVFDFKEEDGKLTIYKIPSYEIIISEIKSVAPPKEFKEVEYKNFMLTK
ncbi:hypothetical protein RN96_12530 [Fusobacterium polymorphum]|uniref:Uncharacterized protein n=1 Tax=Fusobacterium nucleatum subsp. polymorphum TaxID=76857 RepID=A0A2B7YFW7_FUSNP|nr:hypothetical protein [Fusobacterium polymorphum]PGH19931.1 hypothetical protein RN96_12530 [Fusobacterium polymorphum]